MILYSLLPFFKKERINFNSEIESNKISYKRLLSNLKEKKKLALEEANDRKTKKTVRKFFKKEIKNLKSKHKEMKLQAKINFMSAVSKNKEVKENVKLIKKSKSNLHRVLYDFARLPFDEKKNSIVVEELSPSKEVEFTIRKRIFNDLDTYGSRNGDRIFVGEKDILFTTIKFGTGTEKIPMVLRYSGQCVPIFLEKVRNDSYDKFSNENEHHLEVLCAKFREIKAPKQGLKMNKFTAMAILFAVCLIGYFAYKYYAGQA